MLSTTLRACWSTLLLVCLLSACGGGGGGGASNGSASNGPIPTPSDGETSPTPRYATVAGTAVKGIIGNATVSAYTVNDDGSRGALLGVSQSAADGSFSIEILAQTTPVWVELTTSPTAFMVCDSLEGCGDTTQSETDSNSNGTIDFGERMPLAPGFQLKALLPDAQEGRVSATISPLTHLATVLAETFPQGIDGLSIAMANSQVANLFALDANILTTAVPDVTQSNRLNAASAQQRKYALILGAFAALAQNGDFMSLLQEAAQQFATLQGQLPNRSDSNSALSLSAWAEKAMALAAHIDDDELTAAFAALKNAADIATTDTTSAAPDSNITSNELKAAKALIANVHELKGTLDVTSATSPLPGFSPLVSASENIVENADAMTRASRLGAFVAVPKIALEAACNSISNFFTAYLCRTIIANKTLEEICTLTFSSLSIGGKTLCEYLNALRLPAGNGLIAELALMDGVASIEGENDGTQVNMQLQQGVTSNNNQISMAWSGDFDSEGFSLQMPDGSINFHFDNLTTFSSLSHPSSIDSTFNATMDLKVDQVSRFDGSAKASIDLTDDDNPVTSTQLTGVYTDSTGQPINVNLAMTLQDSVGTLLSANFAHPLDGNSVTMTLAHSESGDTLRLQWAGSTVNVGTNTSQQTVTLNNGGAVAINLNLESSEDESMGYMTYNGKPYGDVVWEENTLVVKLPNGQTADLF